MSYKGLSPKDSISKFLADRLSPRMMYWAIIRAFAHTTTKECKNKTPDETGYSDLIKSWEKLI